MSLAFNFAAALPCYAPRTAPSLLAGGVAVAAGSWLHWVLLGGIMPIIVGGDGCCVTSR